MQRLNDVKFSSSPLNLVAADVRRLITKVRNWDFGTRKKIRASLYRLLQIGGILSLSSLLIGCATTSTLQKRINERPAAYRSLSPEFKALVNQGQIKAGMPADAVYLAWGAPSEILRSGDARGETTRWLYYGTYLQEFRYWTGSRGRGFPSAQLEHDYIPRDYVSAEVILSNGVVKSWAMRPQPTY